MVLNTVLHDTTGDILLSLNYGACPLDTVIRFPSGIDNPTVNGMPFNDDLKAPRCFDGEIILSDENGEVFRVTVATQNEIKASVSADGNIDIFLPSIAPVTEKSRSQVNFIIGFTEYSIYE